MTNTSAPSPFHAGEVAIQQQLGVAERMASFGSRVVRDYMPDQHRQFYAQLPFVAVGTVDEQGRPWAALLEGEPGFALSPAPTLLDLSAAPSEQDPASAGWKAGAAIGLLGIELHTRRRNRVNGQLQSGPRGLQLRVEHAFGNCPQYIQARELRFAHPPGTQPFGAVSQGGTLDETASTMIRASDTCFVASYVDHAKGNRSVDVSHRGGKSGFVRVCGNRLSIPDFAGNLHFNTLGNFLRNPRGGLLFADFETGDVLQLSGRIVLDFAANEVRYFQGAERLWHLEVEHWQLRRGALALRGSGAQMSVNSAMTGSWEETAARVQAEQQRETWRPFRITRIDSESSVVKSYWLEPADGGGLNLFQPGQHLPVRAVLPGGTGPTERTYTLSVAPSDGAYRLSIRRQGEFSTFMHEGVKVGDAIEARAPRGVFTVDALADRPLVLISAGVGITPMLSMLRHVVHEGLRKRRVRPTWFIHSGRNEQERGFSAEVARVAQAVPGSVHIVQVLTQPGPAAQVGIDFDAKGPIDVAMLKSLLPSAELDAYLCGPPAFMQSLYAALRGLQVPDANIHAESFGPAALRREGASELRAIASQAVSVHFTKSGKEALWAPDSGSLLELAETHGLSLPHSCRQGVCGSCSHPLRSGSITYAAAPACVPAAGCALLCQAVPAEGTPPVVIEA